MDFIQKLLQKRARTTLENWAHLNIPMAYGIYSQQAD